MFLTHEYTVLEAVYLNEVEFAPESKRYYEVKTVRDESPEAMYLETE